MAKFQIFKDKRVWILVAIFLPVAFLQFAELIGNPSYIANITAELGLSRYTVERILYLFRYQRERRYCQRLSGFHPGPDQKTG